MMPQLTWQARQSTLSGDSPAVLRMYHVDKFVVKQILYLLPAVTKYLKGKRLLI